MRQFHDHVALCKDRGSDEAAFAPASSLETPPDCSSGVMFELRNQYGLATAAATTATTTATPAACTKHGIVAGIDVLHGNR